MSACMNGRRAPLWEEVCISAACNSGVCMLSCGYCTYSSRDACAIHDQREPCDHLPDVPLTFLSSYTTSSGCLHMNGEYIKFFLNTSCCHVRCHWHPYIYLPALMQASSAYVNRQSVLKFGFSITRVTVSQSVSQSVTCQLQSKALSPQFLLPRKLRNPDFLIDGKLKDQVNTLHFRLTVLC